jgi:hypothetical protein
MIDTKAFTFIVSLAAVINGLGIVRWITTLAEFLRRRSEVKIKIDPAYCLFAIAQFLFHIIFWWTIWGLHTLSNFTFIDYLYLLLGPALLYLGTSLLVPNASDEAVDLVGQYLAIRKDYWTIFALLFLWAIFLRPMYVGSFAPHAPLFSLFVISAIILRQTENRRLTLILAIANCAILVAYIALFALNFGDVNKDLITG